MFKIFKNIQAKKNRKVQEVPRSVFPVYYIISIMLAAS